MVNEVETKECYRADHLLEDRLEELLADPMLGADRRRELEDMQARVDEFKVQEMSDALKNTETKAPTTTETGWETSTSPSGTTRTT